MNPVMTVQEASALLGLAQQTVRIGMQQGAFRFGTVVKGKRGIHRYVIYRKKFEEETGISTDSEKEKGEQK